ncbi:hypothetical protein [Alloactinosynnema sp. L-07]|uniref:hypothetical protein n=1 Tax=Alloactinosynnema sp. L-07 TaxID=1653480 RepID=UPI00065F00D8|nr:hypothetical protein [Alloactinosynnema sp. L-07]CRK56484.1 hypothetical protein [Alloactinosynnema sp. L-07]
MVAQMDVGEVRRIAREARAELGAVPPATEGEAQVKAGTALLRHEGATPTLNTMAERLQEALAELSALTGDVIDALGKSADLLGDTEKANTHSLSTRKVS